MAMYLNVPINYLSTICRGKGPKPYVRPWALFKDTNWSEGKEVNGERPSDQTL